PAPEDMFETVTIDSGIQNFVEGLKGKFKEFQNWLNTKFAPSFDAWDKALDGLKGPFDNMVTSIKQSLKGLQEGGFGQLLDYLKNTFLPDIVNEFSINFAPIFADIMPVMFDEFAKDFEFACNKINLISEDILKPAFEFVKKVATNVFQTIGETWDKYGAGILEKFIKFKESLREIWDSLYYNIIKPVCDSIGGTIDKLWDEHLSPLWGKISGFFGAFIEAILTVWNNVISPFINWLIQTIGPVVSGIFDMIMPIIGGFGGIIADVIGTVFGVLEGLMNFITGVFSGDWERAWTSICDIFSSIWNGIVSVFKGIVNAIIGFINGLINFIWPALTNLVNTFSGVAGFVGGLFGQKWSFTMPSKPYQIPYLASGGILTAPTVAMLGEYPGAFANPEIAAPQSVMQETFLASLTPLVEVLQDGFDRVVQAVDDKELDTYFEGKPLARALKPYLDAENARIGAPLFAR
ncbi:MAG: phage tail protein, partial [Oscillospiraceae bacterium]